ncbi:chloride channel protein [Lacimicrobium alkaliphilum]|uniref:Voltage-gated chloride channel n=1 Tax=Lacimicrobium alkaliphilum TaxID=1526571 RepID=A0A0U2RJC7_9ALTE|nr:chloride channel protein [Lacimicrobium alkaliphilum]ALS97338.1 voltage-gated chloride channel [Lacimicrobium alkaliphilum]
MSLQGLRRELAHPRTSVQLCLLGIVGGSCAALLIILFRLSIETIQHLYIQQFDNFTTLAAVDRFILPIIGAVLILFFAYLTGFKHYRMGIPYVIHRVKHRYGLIPLRTSINQFFGGVIALASGFSVGREGPSVHLGAAGSSFLGQWLKLPYNSIRILAGCGIAAGISASFNTPFAAVIFVMEVVLREYKIHIFIPVMLAAACGSVLTRLVFGEGSELDLLHFVNFSYWIYLYLIPVGMVLGALATLFNNQLMNLIRWFRPLNMVSRLLLAGLLTGVIGYLLPQAMGSGMSSIQFLVNSPDNLVLLFAILAAKLALTLIALGLGIPGGIIGPVIGMGVLAGAILLLPLGVFIEDTTELTGSFALLGMAGLLTAVLHAPLAALSAVMELSFSPQVILPAMMVIVPAYVTSTQLLGNRSIFIRQLDFQKLSYTSSSIREHLQKTGVLAEMKSDFKLFNDPMESQLLAHLQEYPTELVVQARDFEIGKQFALVQYDTSLGYEGSPPLKFFTMEGLPSQATLAEVYEELQASRDGAVYIYEDSPEEIVGIITWNRLHAELLKEQY